MTMMAGASAMAAAAALALPLKPLLACSAAHRGLGWGLGALRLASTGGSAGGTDPSTGAEPCLYAELGVALDATQDDIKLAFKAVSPAED